MKNINCYLCRTLDKIYISDGTRFFIAFSTRDLTQFIDNPTKMYFKLLQYLVRYLNNTKKWSNVSQSIRLSSHKYSDSYFWWSHDARSTSLRISSLIPWNTHPLYMIKAANNLIKYFLRQNMPRPQNHYKTTHGSENYSIILRKHLLVSLPSSGIIKDLFHCKKEETHLYSMWSSPPIISINQQSIRIQFRQHRRFLTCILNAFSPKIWNPSPNETTQFGWMKTSTK